MNTDIEKLLQNFINKIEPKIIEIDGPDYYITQSHLIENPDLLIIGINPAGDKKLSQSEFPNKSPKDIIYTSNQYLENPSWKISRNLNYILSGEKSKNVYKNSVILNYIGINTNSASDLKRKELKNLVEDCKNFSENLIYNVLKPKNILILGSTLASQMNINFHHLDDSVLRTEDEQSYLVLKKHHKNINHYLIYHPSTPKLNGNEHLEKKKIFFNNIF